jgi:Domain of Unknown Function (DUF928)
VFPLRLLPAPFLAIALLFTSLSTLTHAVPFNSLASVRPITFAADFDPPGDDAPDDTVGAGSRTGGQCASQTQQVEPIVPVRNYGLTLEERPEIWVNLAQVSAKQVILVFANEAGTSYQRAAFPMPSQPGIVSFKLPDQAPPLTVGKNYRWSLVVVCGDSVQPDDAVLSGWVQRVDRTALLDRQLSRKSLVEQAQWYGENGFWYDLIVVLHEMRQSQPEMWRDFLTTAGVQN